MSFSCLLSLIVYLPFVVGFAAGCCFVFVLDVGVVWCCCNSVGFWY